MSNRPSRKQGPAKFALLTAGTVLMLIVLAALLTSCAKVDPINETEVDNYSEVIEPIPPSAPLAPAPPVEGVLGSTPQNNVATTNDADSGAQPANDDERAR